MITVTELEDSKDDPVGFVIIVDAESIKSLRKLVQRGANLWPDAPAEIKEFADKITNGQVLQDYRTQDTSGQKSFRIAMPLASPEHCTHQWSLRDCKATDLLEAYCTKCGTVANESLRQALLDSL